MRKKHNTSMAKVLRWLKSHTVKKLKKEKTNGKRTIRKGA